MDPNGSGIGSFLSSNNFQKSGFSAAISGNQSDLISFFNMKADVFKKNSDSE
jgi:hypothetical protein